MQLADRVLTILTVLALVVQLVCFILHIRESQAPAMRVDQKHLYTPQSPPVQGSRVILSAAEEGLLEEIDSIEKREEARKVLSARARGPGRPDEKSGSSRILTTKLPAMYGTSNKPVLAGLDSCGPFRAGTSLFRRAAVAGLFNSGTNVLHNLMRKNCHMPMACPNNIGPKAMETMMKNRQCIGYPFQVPWGKHNPEKYRRSDHVVSQLAHFNRSEILPIVVIKDPISWMRSMCRLPYAAHFPRQKNTSCPSPLNPQYLNTNDSVSVKWRNNHLLRYSSLLDLWNTWYSDYWHSPQPRIFVRYEDLLFQSRETIKSLCDCAGGTFKHDNFDPIAQPAKSGKGHGGQVGTSRIQALQRYGSEAIRYKDLDQADIHYYNTSAHPELSHFFQYLIPLSTIPSFSS